MIGRGLLIAFGLLCLSIGALLWLAFRPRTAYALESSDGTTVRVREAVCLDDCVVEVDITRGWARTEIQSETDCVVNFAHAKWFGSVVAVFVDNAFCADILVAFETSTKTRVPLEAFRAEFIEDLARDYRITDEEVRACNGDILAWARNENRCAGGRSQAEWQRRHPVGLF